MTEKNRNSNYYDYHNNDKNSYNNKYNNNNNNNNNNNYNTNSNEYLIDQGHDINSDKIKNGDIYNDENNNNDNNNYENSDFVSASNGDQNNFYDFYGNQNYGKYENNPLLNIFDSSSTSIMPFTRNLDFDLEHDDDHPMYANYIDRHGQIDATNNPYYSKEMERRSISSLPDKLEIEEKSDKKGPAWVEGLLLNPLSAVQVAAANINPLGLESLGLGSWLDLLNMGKVVDNYEYLTCETNPLHSISVIQDSRALQTAIRKRYVRVNHLFHF